jgi:hypothetical protein
MESLSCPNRHRPLSGKGHVAAVIRHGFYTKVGKASLLPVMLNITYKEPVPLTQLNPSLDSRFNDLLKRALAKHPAERYQSGRDGKTFCSTSGTPYYRLQHRRATFDEVTFLSVKGLNKSAIARVKRVAGTRSIVGWKKQPGGVVGSAKLKGLSILELQADEIRRIIRGREQAIWVFVVIDVWSRLWPSTWSANEAIATRWIWFETFPTQ